MNADERKYSVTVVPEKDEEVFTRSECKCMQCLLMHAAVEEWETFVPETKLQESMLKIVSKLEKDIKRNEKKRKHKKEKENVRKKKRDE